MEAAHANHPHPLHPHPSSPFCAPRETPFLVFSDEGELISSLILRSRYLRSLVETILIYQQFNKPGAEQPSPKQELVDFWMDFLVEATKRDVSSVRFPVSRRGTRRAKPALSADST